MVKKNKKIDPLDCYYDCAFQVTDFGDRRFSSGWTPHGIRCLDAEYSRRIQHILMPVVKLIKVTNTPHYRDGNYASNYWDEYLELPLDEDFYSYDRCIFAYHEDAYIELPKPEGTEKWRGQHLDEDGNPKYQKRKARIAEYCYTHPTYSAKHKGEDPEMLRDEILKNPSLHQVIKDNLIENLNNYLGIENKVVSL